MYGNVSRPFPLTFSFELGRILYTIHFRVDNVVWRLRENVSNLEMRAGPQRTSVEGRLLLVIVPFVFGAVSAASMLSACATFATSATRSLPALADQLSREML